VRRDPSAARRHRAGIGAFDGFNERRQRGGVRVM
jgi:hypothetical protein